MAVRTLVISLLRRWSFCAGGTRELGYGKKGVSLVLVLVALSSGCALVFDVDVDEAEDVELVAARTVGVTGTALAVCLTTTNVAYASKTIEVKTKSMK